ncbi:MAG TPA: energy transducer TonB [Maribacter sp.]|uniref:energy transducer TonB n=1 Tax=unclassified Maribacter TaxID=2615042 RepID=UPI000EDF911D|nr:MULTISPECIES: energy transducer TonB [unclassified Maribacter]HAF78757.1 energy transducer TonB [Maribacter sp.]HAI42984.1 energy transducer TonB [Maribacter sp.]|tara:strand:+ start:47689 stop:48393 length:705 start_codon:yes stop_codon:yes gene_type:complete
MRSKKNPQKDLNKKSGTFFVIGLLLVLAMVYTALEWKSFDPINQIDVALNKVDDSIIEEATIIELKATPPPKPKVLPIEIEIIEDDEPIIETEVIASEVDTDTEIVDPSDFEVIEEPEEVKVIWTTIEEVPIFPGCESAEDKRACFNEMMQKHIRKNFRYPELAQEMGIQGRVNTQFMINNDGTIGAIQKRGPHDVLEKEAVRILSKLPKMTPGKQRGSAVKVSFAIPITFKLE